MVVYGGVGWGWVGVGLTLAEAPSLLLVVVVGGGAPQPAVAAPVGGALGVLLSLEEEREHAGLSAGRAPVHHRNYTEQWDRRQRRQRPQQHSNAAYVGD